jgi:hypothetical protein
MAISIFEQEDRQRYMMREMEYRLKQEMLREMDRHAQQANAVSPYQNAYPGLGTLTGVTGVTSVTSISGGMDHHKLSQAQMAAAQVAAAQVAAAQVESKTPNDPLGFMKLADSKKLLLTGVKP